MNRKKIYAALEAAEIALADLGACDDPNCAEPNCVHALAKVRAALAEMRQGAKKTRGASAEQHTS